MRLRVATTLAFVMSVSAANAEVTVRSGEHDTFSRLVFTTPVGMQWRIAEGDGRATVRLDSDTERFDVSEIFARIPRTRLALATDTGDGGLQLDLNCDCPLDAFQLNNRVFVIDIRDPVEAPIEAPAPAPSNPAQDRENDTFRLPILPETANNAAVVPPLGFRDLGLSNVADISAGTFPSESPQVAEARERLRAQLEFAADNQLLDMPTPLIGFDPPGAMETDPSTPSETASVDLPEAAPDQSTPASANIRVETSADKALETAMSRFLGVPESNSCVSDENLEVAGWSEGLEFEKAISGFRRQLYGEFDRLDTEAAIGLARFYIGYGLGAEALLTLSLIENRREDHNALVAMAETMEYGAARSKEAFTNQFSCDGSAALWAVLTAREVARDKQINGDAVLNSFNALPLHLKTLLGPILSEKLRKAGQIQMAETAMRMVSRGSPNPDSATTMELSQLALAEGDEKRAEDMLSEVVSLDDPPSPRALIDLVDLQIGNQTPISAAYVTLAAAYAFEFRETEIGPALKRTHVLALASTDRFQEALDELQSWNHTKEEDTYRETASFVFDTVAQRASDSQFLELATPFVTREATSLSSDTQNTVAARFLDLGITAPVSGLISAGASGATGRERRLLRARLALLDQRPGNALEHLLGLEGPEADRQRARAFEDLRQFDRAQAMYETLGNAGKAREMALFGEDWAYLEANEEGALGRTAQDRLRGPDQDFSVAGLAKSEAAITGSQATRENVESLLLDFQVDAALSQAMQ